jgi:hypothetical protein
VEAALALLLVLFALWSLAKRLQARKFSRWLKHEAPPEFQDWRAGSPDDPILPSAKPLQIPRGPYDPMKIQEDIFSPLARSDFDEVIEMIKNDRVLKPVKYTGSGKGLEDLSSRKPVKKK